jgi:phosphoglycerate dehydrogenase-like enzyme
VLARFGVGHDGIDKRKATAAGILCTNTPGVLDQSVAEHTMLLIGAAARQLVPMALAMQNLQWAARGGSELHAKTLAVIGAGPIGRAVARIAALGFGMRVIGMDVEPRSPADGFEKITDNFDEAVAGADYVSLHIPASPENAGFLNAVRISRMQAGAWLINTARGAVVDERDLFDALAAGRLAGAALDVFEREPYLPADQNRDLRSLPNVILLPHVGSNTVEANRRMAERALRNVALAEAGELGALDLLNRDVLSLLRT